MHAAGGDGGGGAGRVAVLAGRGADQGIHLELRHTDQFDGLALPGTDNGVVRMQVTALHSAMPALLAELVRRGVRLTELRTHSASLEDVFVTLTGRHLRDA